MKTQSRIRGAKLGHVEQERGRDVVGEVADDPQVLGERAEVELERVALVHDHRLRREAPAQGLGELAVDLDHVQGLKRLGEPLREGAGPRPDLDHRLARPRVDLRDDPVEVVAVGEEVLPKPLLRARQHRRP